MSYFDSDAQDMLEVYLLETRQLTDQLSAVLLEAEKNNFFTENDIHSIFRIMHTIKSSSAMMGLEALSAMAHKLEDLFSYFRAWEEKLLHPEPELFDLLFGAADFIEGELDRMEDTDYEPDSAAKIEARAEEYLQKLKVGQEETEEHSPPLEEDSRLSVPEAFMKQGYIVVRILFESGCKMENIRAFMLIRQIEGLCSELASYPESPEKSNESAELISQNGLFLRFKSEKKEEVLESLKRGLFVEQCEIVRDEQPEPESKEESEAAPEAVSGQIPEKKDTEYLAVRTERLDKLQNFASELMIQMMILDNELERHGLNEVKETTAYQINRLVGEVERTVMQIRMVPVERIVPKLKRILRDICRNQGKEAELIVNCGDIEADKSVVDYVSEALIHVIRNAVDHGIELPEERIEAGKDRKGKVVFEVESRVGELFLSVSDDGRGIDRKKVLERAREKGVLTDMTPENGDETEESQINRLIMAPGFTTNDEVTEYSGRGVGLDVVKNILEQAGGNLYVRSESGKGSCFTISVPLTLSTMECIRFLVENSSFSLPARYVYRFMEYESSRKLISERNGKECILFEDRMVPLIDLRKYFGLGGRRPDSSIIVYVKGVKKEGCFLLDSMYEQKRIVVKPLPSLFGIEFRRKTGISGLSIMGDGRICIALDTEILISRQEKGAAYGN